MPYFVHIYAGKSHASPQKLQLAPAHLARALTIAHPPHRRKGNLTVADIRYMCRHPLTTLRKSRIYAPNMRSMTFARSPRNQISADFDRHDTADGPLFSLTQSNPYEDDRMTFPPTATDMTYATDIVRGHTRTTQGPPMTPAERLMRQT